MKPTAFVCTVPEVLRFILMSEFSCLWRLMLSLSNVEVR